MSQAEIQKLVTPPISVGAAAIYPFKKDWMEVGEREAKYPDEDGNKKFNLFRLTGPLGHQKIWVPRNMAPNIPADVRVVGADVKFKSSFKPRNSEQARVIAEAVAHLKAGRSFVLEAPTGFGKTWCSSDIIAGVGKKTCIVVTKEDVRDQWLEAFEKILGLTRENGIGLIQGNVCDTLGKKIVVAMVQSLAKDERYPAWHFKDFGFVIWDEVHRVGADFFSNSCFRLPALLRMGISATPDRKDGREEVIAAHIGPTLVRSTVAPMIPRVIVEPSGWHCPKRRKLDSQGRAIVDEDGKVVMVPIPHTAGKCSEIIRMLVHNHDRNRKITGFVKKAYDAGRKVLVQSDTKDHLEILASLFAASGVPTREITFYVGGLTKAQRERAKVGSVILATYAQTKEATDIPELDTLVMATPKSDVRQIVGRVLRFLPDKKQPLVLDLRDDESPVFKGYGQARSAFYKSMGATVQHVKDVALPQIDKQGKSVTIESFVKQAVA